ncbi:hypothetical protein [Erwinia sp. 9145]|uniref:hypothetical protein n=1 Tax=Erwinia sp. 9145 TaxID=1500895 RepID=UPI0005545217|nr:hypothetical protein [Erwinia sp. 9145]
MKYIYDTKLIMQNAWAKARVAYAKNPSAKTLRQRFVFQLGEAWQDAIDARNQLMQHEENRKNAIGRKSRYIELLTVAEENNLNHGQEWVCAENNLMFSSWGGERDLFFGAPNSWLGEQICYVYTR